MAETNARSALSAADAADASVRQTRGLWSDAWARLRRNQTAMAGAVIIVLLIGVALSAPYIAPFDPIALRTGSMVSVRPPRICTDFPASRMRL